MLDENDRKVLNAMMADARISAREIARKTKLSTQTVINHITSLEARKIICGYSPMVDREKLGKQKFELNVQVVPRAVAENDTGLEKLRDLVYKYPEVVGFCMTSGKYALSFMIESESHEKVIAANKALLIELQKWYDIKDYETRRISAMISVEKPL